MGSTIRRLGAVAASALVAGAFVAGPAGAATNENYVGSATATALKLDALGQALTLANTTAKATSGLVANATGDGQLLPAANATSSRASVTGDNTTQNDPDKCGPISTPAELEQIGLRLATACSSSISEVKGGMPHASSESSVAAIDVSANTILSQVPQLNQTIDQVQAALTPVLGQLDTVTKNLGISVSDTVGTLVDKLQTQQTAAIRVGNSTSDVLTNGTAVTSNATAAGAQVDLLNVGAVVNGIQQAPLVSIIVGSAKATSTYDRQAGTSKASFDPAVVRVVTNLAGALKQEIAVAPGQSIKILEGTPLESEIIAGAGSQVKNPDGSVGAIADGVALHLLKGINGGINLNLAHAEAGVAGSPAVRDVVDVPRASELPRTGGPGPWVPVAGATLVVAAVLTRRFVLRTR